MTLWELAQYYATEMSNAGEPMTSSQAFIILQNLGPYETICEYAKAWSDPMRGPNVIPPPPECRS